MKQTSAAKQESKTKNACPAGKKPIETKKTQKKRLMKHGYFKIICGKSEIKGMY